MRIPYYLLFATFFMLLFTGCTNSEDSAAVIQGTVSDSQSGDVIENATVQISSPEEFSSLFARTDSSGRYTIGDIQLSSLTEMDIVANATNYRRG